MVSSLWITPRQVQLTILPSLPPADRWTGALCPSDHSRGSWPEWPPLPHASQGSDPLIQPPGFSSLLTHPKRNQETWLDPLCRRYRAIPPRAPPSPGQAAASLSSGSSSQSSVPVPESVIPLCPAGPGRPGSPCLVASLQLRGRESPPAAQVPCRAMWPPCSQLPPQPHAPSLWRPLRPRKAAMPQPLSAIVHSTSPGGEGLSLLLLRTSCPLRVMGSPRAQPPSHWGDVVQTLC